MPRDGLFLENNVEWRPGTEPLPICYMFALREAILSNLSMRFKWNGFDFYILLEQYSQEQ